MPRKENLEMPDSSLNEYGTTELDEKLLATPFKVQIKWHAITGASPCGKNTLTHLFPRDKIKI